MFAHLGNRTGKLLKGGGVWVHTALLASVELDHTPGDSVGWCGEVQEGPVIKGPGVRSRLCTAIS